MTSEISHSIKNKVKPNDVFYTPLSLIQIHLELVREFVKENDIIFEPFYGDGRYYDKFNCFNKNTTHEWTEICLDRDFFTYDKNVDVIISNPPYSCIDKVLEKSVSLNPHTISYLIGHHNLTNKRIEFMNNAGYSLVKLHFTKVNKWYGMSLICVFTKGGTNCISYDRTIHK
jgi:hypothetical protein